MELHLFNSCIFSELNVNLNLTIISEVWWLLLFVKWLQKNKIVRFGKSCSFSCTFFYLMKVFTGIVYCFLLQFLIVQTIRQDRDGTLVEYFMLEIIYLYWNCAVGAFNNLATFLSWDTSTKVHFVLCTLSAIIFLNLKFHIQYTH